MGVLIRRAAKVDSNHAAILEGVRAAGWKAISTAPLGNNVPDQLCAKGGLMVLLECKSGGKGLTKGQQEFKDGWPAPVVVARTVNETVLELEAVYRTFLGLQ